MKDGFGVRLGSCCWESTKKLLIFYDSLFLSSYLVLSRWPPCSGEARFVQRFPLYAATETSHGVSSSLAHIFTIGIFSHISRAHLPKITSTLFFFCGDDNIVKVSNLRHKKKERDFYVFVTYFIFTHRYSSTSHRVTPRRTLTSSSGGGGK